MRTIEEIEAEISRLEFKMRNVKGIGKDFYINGKMLHAQRKLLLLAIVR